MPRTYTQGDEPIPGSGYRLSSFLGRGGFGEVWKATAPGGAEAALKIIHLGGQEGRKEFRALQLVKRVRHPNLVPIIGFWLKSQDGAVLDDAFTGLDALPADATTAAPLRQTMVAPPDLGRAQAAELIVAMGLGDQSLFDRFQQCREDGRDGIPPEELLGYMKDVAVAIDFLNSPVHDMGSGPAAIQHCDIKPHNLMIVGGAAQICDFGLARMMGADRTTSASATIAYAAPECLQTGLPSATTDQYSLAISYYELRTGVLPYKDETLAAVLAAKEQGKLDFSRLGPAEQDVLRRATLRDPAKRYPTAAAMVEGFRAAFVAGDAATVEVAGVPARRRVRRPARWLLSLMGLVGLGIGVWLAWGEYGARWLGGGQELAQNVPPTVKPPTVKPNPVHPSPLPSAVPPPQPTSVELAETHSATGEKRLAERQWEKAVAELSDAINIRPSAKDLIGRGHAYYELDRATDALADFDAAIREDSQSAAAHFWRGKVRLGKKDYAGATADFDRVASLDPNGDLAQASRRPHADACFELGTIALRAHDNDKAISYFDLAAKERPDDARIFSRRASAWFDKHDATRAIDDYNIALKIKPSDVDYVARGVVHQAKEEPDLAFDDFSKAIGLNPGNANAYLHRGDIGMTRFDESGKPSDLDLAKTDLTRAVELCRNDEKLRVPLANALLYRALCQMLAEDHDAAASDFRAWLQEKPENMKSLHGPLDELAQKFAEKGELAKAAEWEAKALDLAPDGKKAEYQDRLKRYKSGKP